MTPTDTAKTQSDGERKPAVPSISLPKGGGAIRGMGEKFTANPVTGTGSMTVPIAKSPGRSGFGPQLSLSYDSGSGNGPFGFGWSLSLPAITRKTDKGLPQYQDTQESDVYVLSGAEDLVPVLEADGTRFRDDTSAPGFVIHRYRPRIEGLFARIERWTRISTGEIHWRSITRDNVTTLYGKDNNSRVFDPADPVPAHPTRIYSWLICESYDDKGNAIVYEYAEENGDKVDLVQTNERNRVRTANRYLKRVKYGNRVSRLIEPDLSTASWMFEVVLDYDEGHYEEVDPNPPPNQHRFVRASVSAGQPWAVRPDPFSLYRAGFEVRTYRRCRRVLMFHHIPELPTGEKGYDGLVRSTEFDYADLGYEQPVTIDDELAHQGSTRFASFIRRVTQSGYVRDETQAVEVRNGISYTTYLKKSLPPLEFEYSKASILDQVLELDTESIENLPEGLDGTTYQWVDLDGEGLFGILTEQAGAWFYKPNLGGGRFGPLETIAAKPSLAALSGGRQQLLDLAGDGQLDLVALAGPTPGFYERTFDHDWAPFRTFRQLPNIPWGDPNLRFVDLDGDGHADVLITEQDVFTWHPSLAEEGFGPAQRVRQTLDDERGPRLVFADGTQSIYLADMCGDGLTDLVRIRDGEVCYWPNLGYGRFDAKVTMDNAPWFDHPDQFDQKRIRLADIDGSGTNDIIYLARDGVWLYFNQSGNRLSEARRLDQFPRIDNVSSVMTADLLGNGTACLVWSSPLPSDAQRPLRYIDLMGGIKPHLLVKSVNNLGAETEIHYAPSTYFYLKDKRDGRPWVTRLPFPVHVVERLVTRDRISGNCFATRYAYHHGYFDGIEREFRGFGMVEQWDTEEFAAQADGQAPAGTNIDASSHVPPVLTRTWFHTGIYLSRGHVSNFFAGMLDGKDIGEYFREPAIREDDAEVRKFLLDDTVLEDVWSLEEAREACRALKGSMLRQEVYALDAPGTDEYPSGLPYTVTEQNFTIRRIQAKGGNRHGVFFAHSREAINYHYECNPDDPRISHTLTLVVDNYGNVLRSVAIGYRRRSGSDAQHTKQEHTHITFTANRVANYPQEQDWYRIGLPVETRTFEIVNPWEPELSGPRVVPFSFKNIHDEMELLWPEAQLDPPGGKLWPYENWDWRRQESQRPQDTRLRLIEHVRTLYRPDDMGESENDALALLPLGTAQSLALPGETFKLAFTPDLLDQIYERGGQKLLPANVEDLLQGGGGERGGYIDWDGVWWIPSGRIFYTTDPEHMPGDEHSQAREHFFVPRCYRDPFHKLDDSWDTETDDSWDTETIVDYDAYDLLVQETRDTLDNRVTVGKRNRADNTLEEQGNDYRVLQPRLMMDPNDNCSEVAFDALGLVVGTAVMGKPGQQKGDLIDNTFSPNLPDAEISAFYDAADPHTLAPDQLAKATTRIIYDMGRFQKTQQDFPDDPHKWAPPFAATLAREVHFHDPGGNQSKIQISFSYSDGFGREIQKKIQTEKGPVPKRDVAGKIIVGPDGQPEMTDHDVSPRWVGSGWTIFNNKGKPVRQYEPFFSDTHKPDFDTKIGVSPVLFYDPVERVIATLHPNGTYEKVVFNPWQQATYDVNDTVSLEPYSDPDIKGHVEKYCGSLPDGWTTWLQQRNVDPDNPPADTKGVDPERDAAVRTLKHANTPTLVHFDSLGRTFLTVADNGKDSDGNPLKYHTGIVLDIEGNQREVIDARDRVVMHYDYDLLGNRIHQASMDAGQRWMLNDIIGKPIRAWDSRGHNFVTKYDRLRRPVEQWVRGTDAAQSDQRTLNEDVLFAKTEYGEGEANLALNLRTRMFRQYDGAGVVTNEAYDFKGNLTRSSRQVYPDYKNIINWDTTQPAGESFSSSTDCDALNRPVSLVAPDNSEIRPTYNEANLLDALEANLRGDSTATKFVTNIDYNAKGQRLRIDYENGATTHYRYDEETFRLIRLHTVRGNKSAADCAPIFEPRTCEDPPAICQRLATNACIVQDLSYTYDPAGNITHIRDDAQQIVYFRNKRVEPSNDYIYDAIYRLIQATGREHLGQNGGGSALPPRSSSYNDGFRSGLPHPGDGNAMGTYREIYAYDEVGNILSMRHRGTDPGHAGWKSCYQYAVDSNRLLSTNNSNDALSPDIPCPVHYAPAPVYSDRYDYDSHGNMLKMPQLQIMQWDFQDRLQVTQRQKVATDPDDEEGQQHQGEKTYYIYDASGQRVRKVTERHTPAGQAPTRMKERIYVGDLEIYWKYNGDGDTVTLERKTLHIMDDKQRIALVETRTQGNDGSPGQLIRYQFGNHLGSANLELDHQSKVLSYEEYAPYGSTSYQAVDKTVKVAAKRYRYTGKERDEESGLYYSGARYCAAWLGRWTAADPAGHIDGPNLYMYVRSSPTQFVDSTGLIPIGFGELQVETSLGQARVQAGIKVSEGKGQGRPITKIEFDPLHIEGDPERFKTRPKKEELLKARDKLEEQDHLDVDCGVAAQRIAKKAHELAGLPKPERVKPLRDEVGRYYGLESESESPYITTKREVREAEQRLQHKKPDSVTKNKEGQWVLNIHHGEPSDPEFEEKTQHLVLQPGMKIHISEGAGQRQNKKGDSVRTHNPKHGGKTHMLTYAGEGTFVDASGKSKFGGTYYSRAMLVVLRVYDPYDTDYRRKKE